MESIRKHSHFSISDNRDIVYVVGQYANKYENIVISEITTGYNNLGMLVDKVYIKSPEGESCIWKTITTTTNNVIEQEHDWKDIIGESSYE